MTRAHVFVRCSEEQAAAAPSPPAALIVVKYFKFQSVRDIINLRVIHTRPVATSLGV